MSEVKNLLPLVIAPGIKRDGTSLDNSYYLDGQWIRFQYGRPQKMGGYRAVQSAFSDVSRAVFAYSNGNLTNLYSFHKDGVEMVQTDQNGAGNVALDRTPTGFVGTDELLWSVDKMYDAAVGSDDTVVLAVPTNTLALIDDRTENPLLIGDALGIADFTEVSDVKAVASGGVFCAPPFAVLYGNDGKVTWSNTNEPQNYTTGEAGSARVTGTKIVKGLPIPSSGGPGGLLWSMDSLIRMDYVGGQAIFKFSTLSSSTSILSQNSVVELDNTYFWIGLDRFLMSEGSSVKELPNNMNLQWFFDNLNYTHRQKVWGMAIPKFGEIWWFFPYGDNTECSHAIIFNIREHTWYDVELSRSAGYSASTIRHPILADPNTYELYLHERGKDAIVSNKQLPIKSWLTTGYFSIASNDKQPLNTWTRVLRIEPDIKAVGEITLTIQTREFANSQPVEFGPFSVEDTTEKVDVRLQGRHVSLTYLSNALNGDFELGRTLVHIEPGDIRA